MRPAAYATSVALYYIEEGHTRFAIEDDGSYRIMQISRFRRRMREFISVVRCCIAAFLMYQGTLFLVYTIKVENLLLNAVALEFVISLDELIYDALAPSHAKSFINRTTGFKLPTKHWHGISGRSIIALSLLVGQLSWAISSHLAPQLTVLQNVKDAICAGDRYFVFSVDGIGVVTWGYPPGIEGTVEESIAQGFTHWGFTGITGTEKVTLTGTEKIVDSLLDNQGSVECPATSCFYVVSPTLPSFPLPEDGLGVIPSRASCCVAQSTRAPSIESGRFSVRKKSTETPAEANTMCARAPYARTAHHTRETTDRSAIANSRFPHDVAHLV